MVDVPASNGILLVENVCTFGSLASVKRKPLPRPHIVLSGSLTTRD